MRYLHPATAHYFYRNHLLWAVWFVMVLLKFLAHADVRVGSFFILCILDHHAKLVANSDGGWRVCNRFPEAHAQQVN
jgi:hypothetical protein